MLYKHLWFKALENTEVDLSILTASSSSSSSSIVPKKKKKRRISSNFLHNENLWPQSHEDIYEPKWGLI